MYLVIFSLMKDYILLWLVFYYSFFHKTTPIDGAKHLKTVYFLYLLVNHYIFLGKQRCLLFHNQTVLIVLRGHELHRI